MAYGATLKKLFIKNPLSGGVERAQSGLKLVYIPRILTNQKEGTASRMHAAKLHRYSLAALVTASTALRVLGTLSYQDWRGFLPAGRPEYLDPYNAASETFADHRLYSATSALLDAFDMQLPEGQTPQLPVPKE